MLSSYRRRHRDWDEWLGLLTAIPLIPAVIALLVHFLLVPVPIVLFILILALASAGMILILWNAAAAALRANKRRAKFLDDRGIQCDLGMVMTSREAWKAAGRGATMRDVLKGPPLNTKE